ncbi:MAG TPA: glycosyltransferase family 2 protein [Candidatus Saccharimonadia bacterium]|nr:glycosyltransferase family 2 protein [Candidatus Saccharimonadia bacterium]
MKTFVVIPNWNGIDMIEECLRSLEKQTQVHTVIVVDNGSVDGSNVVVRDKFPKVQLLEFPNNAGFAGGVNRGIRPALEQGADYIALFNNDAVADPHWLERLVAALEADPKAGAVAAKIMTQDGKRLDSTGDFYSIWGMPFPRGRGEEDEGQYDGEANHHVFAVSGGASLYRAKMLKQIGLFDEDFFAYFEDLDISFRGQLAGWTMIYEPHAEVLHAIGGTSSRIDHYKKGQKAAAANHDGVQRPSAFARFHTVKNFAYVYTKDMPGWLYWKYLPRLIVSWGMMLASDLRRGLWRTNAKANFTALAHLPKMLAARRRIQSGRKVSLGYIDGLLYHDFPPLQRARLSKLGLGGKRS